LLSGQPPPLARALPPPGLARALPPPGLALPPLARGSWLLRVPSPLARRRQPPVLLSPGEVELAVTIAVVSVPVQPAVVQQLAR